MTAHAFPERKRANINNFLEAEITKLELMVIRKTKGYPNELYFDQQTLTNLLAFAKESGWLQEN